MNKKWLLVCMCVGLFAVIFVPMEVFAGTSDKYAGKDILEEASHLKELLFGPVMRYVAILSCVWSFMVALFTQAVKQVVFFLGLGLTSGLMPKFIESVYSLMLP